MVTSPDGPAVPEAGHRFIALDSLRGLAALTVAVYHINGTGWLVSLPFFRQGWLAVDFFFVLSGFVIGASYADRLAGGFSIRRFMVLRLGRVYPLLALVLGVYLALELALLWSGGRMVPRAAFAEGHSPEQFLLTAAMLQAFAVPYASAWAPQSWSIAIEVWLYLATALGWRALGRRAGLAALLLALAAAAVLALGEHWIATPLSPDLLRGVLGFGLGMAAWQLWRMGWTAGWSAPSATLAEAATIALAISCVALLPAENAIMAVPDLVFAALVVVFAGDRGRLSRLLSRAPFVRLGVLSYALYMVHGFVEGRAIDLLARVGLGRVFANGDVAGREIVASPWLTDLIAAAMLGAALVVAWAAWRFVEWPARAYSRRLAERIGQGASPAA